MAPTKKGYKNPNTKLKPKASPVDPVRLGTLSVNPEKLVGKGLTARGKGPVTISTAKGEADNFMATAPLDPTEKYMTNGEVENMREKGRKGIADDLAQSKAGRTLNMARVKIGDWLKKR